MYISAVDVVALGIIEVAIIWRGNNFQTQASYYSKQMEILGSKEGFQLGSRRPAASASNDSSNGRGRKGWRTWLHFGTFSEIGRAHV